MNCLDDILHILLSKVESNPNASAEFALKKAIGELNITSDEQNEIEEAFRTLDSINEKSKDLEAAREDGRTRIGWIEDQLSDIADASGDHAEEIISKIQKGTETALDHTLNQEF